MAPKFLIVENDSGALLSFFDGPLTDSAIIAKARALACESYTGEITVERAQLHTAVIFAATPDGFERFVARVVEIL